MVNTDFRTFWDVYPRKTGDKKKTQDKFEKLSEPDRFNAIQGAQYQAEHNPQWRNKKLIPHPLTFLNGQRWKDEIVKDIKEEIVDNQQENPATMVWSAMTQMFGETWINKFGDRPPPVWQKQLEHISIPRIRRGLSRVRDEGLEFPPSLPKFVELCARTPEEVYPPALPRPRGDEKIALEAIAEMKKILGVS